MTVPAAAEVESNRVLDAAVSDGGSWWVGVSSSVPELEDGALVNVTDVGLPLQELPRDGAGSWAPASARRVQPLAGFTWASSPVSFLPVARVFWDGPDPATATPVRWARLGATPVVPVGVSFILPAESCALCDPLMV